MLKILFKIVIGVILGILLCGYAQSETTISVATMCLFILWGVGMVYGVRTFLGWLGATIRSAMQLSLISALSFGTGIIGFIALIFSAAVILAFGWAYGIYMLIQDIFAITK